MNEERLTRSQATSAHTSRLSYGSRRYFDFLDSAHSVFSKESYYSDKKSIHPWLRRPCSRYSGIPLSTLGVSQCSKRTEELAQPRFKRERLIRQEIFDNATNYAYSGVKTTALTTECSEHVKNLAQPKKISPSYLYAYELPRAVPEGALRARLSQRLEELAKPRHNKLTYTQSLWYPK